MKAYYSTSFAYKKNNEKEWADILNVLKKVFGPENVYVPEDEIDLTHKDENIIDGIKKREKALKESDVVIAQASSSSAGVGYNIHTAVSLKKPVLVLMKKDLDKNYAHHTFTAGKVKLITYKEYESTDDAEKTVRKFALSARKMLDTKFILIISPEIDRYLEWVSDEKRMHKAQVVREAVEEMMSKDQEYKKSVKDE